MSAAFLLVVAVVWLAAAVAFVRVVTRQLRRAEEQLRRSNRTVFTATGVFFDFPTTKSARTGSEPAGRNTDS